MSSESFDKKFSSRVFYPAKLRPLSASEFYMEHLTVVVNTEWIENRCWETMLWEFLKNKINGLHRVRFVVPLVVVWTLFYL